MANGTHNSSTAILAEPFPSRAVCALRDARGCSRCVLFGLAVKYLISANQNRLMHPTLDLVKGRIYRCYYTMYNDTCRNILVLRSCPVTKTK